MGHHLVLEKLSDIAGMESIRMVHHANDRRGYGRLKFLKQVNNKYSLNGPVSDEDAGTEIYF
jgi:hypothetical protein